MGNSTGIIRLCNYTNHSLMASKKTPSLPNFTEIYNNETINFKITHVSTFKTHASCKSVTALKYSPKCKYSKYKIYIFDFKSNFLLV